MKSARLKKVALATISVFLTYAAVEAIATALWLSGRLEPEAIYAQEQTDPLGNVRFDRTRGAFFSQQRARLAVFSSGGELLSQGLIAGNNHGFDEGDDFEIQGASDELRFAVLGDSFTAAPFLETSWPERVEQLLDGADGARIRLLNMSLSGGGLGNWWSVIRDFIGGSGLELDGIVLAVYESDIERPFFWSDDALYRTLGAPPRMATGTAISWDPDEVIAPIESANPEFLPNWRLFEPTELDALLDGGREGLALDRPFRLFFAHRAFAALRNVLVGEARAQAGSPHPSDPSDPAREAVLDALADFAEAREMRLLVVAVPDDPTGIIERFALRIGADFHPGSPHFVDRPAELFIPIDGHWNQAGSDRFSSDIVEGFERWARAGRR